MLFVHHMSMIAHVSARSPGWATSASAAPWGFSPWEQAGGKPRFPFNASPDMKTFSCQALSAGYPHAGLPAGFGPYGMMPMPPPGYFPWTPLPWPQRGKSAYSASDFTGCRQGPGFPFVAPWGKARELERQRSVCMYVCMYVRMHVCMHVCV